MIDRMLPVSMVLITAKPYFKGILLFHLNISETMRDRHVGTAHHW